MPRSNVIAGAIAGLFVLYISARGSIATYLAILGV